MENHHTDCGEQMMYLALTYDHRLLDGREAVTFLVKVRHFPVAGFGPITYSITGQGVHRRPAAYAAWVNDSTAGTLVLDLCLLCLEQPLAPFVDYQLLKYNCHVTGLFNLPGDLYLCVPSIPSRTSDVN